MLCGTAFKNKGVQLMLDAVIQLLPSPVDIPPVAGLDDRDRPDSLQKLLTTSRSRLLASS